MEVVTSVREWKKGEFFRRHRHPGIDVAYVMQGSMIQVPGISTALNARDSTAAPTFFPSCRDVQDLLSRDVARANAFFRTRIAPIICAPVQEGGRKFYRATVAARGSEILKSLGLTQAFDFGGCGGPQPLAGKQAARVRLRNCDLRIGPVYLIGDLRTFVPIPYAAVSQGPGHRTWPSGRQAL